MKAVVFDGEIKFVENYPLPSAAAGEALIRVRMAGICSTDLEIIKGYRGFQGVMDHEFVGVVEETSGTAEHLRGRRVVGEINSGCGMCEYCRAGMKRHCPSRTSLGIVGRDGALAEYVVLPAENLFIVPSDIKDEEAVFIEPLAAAYEILEQIHVRPTDAILVLGDGKLGTLAALVLHLSQAQVVLAGKHEDKLSVARNQGVATMGLPDLSLNRIFDVVVDATGSPEGFLHALHYVKPGGTIVLKTTSAENTTVNLASVVVDEIHVVGSRCGPFEPALRSLSEKRIKVGPLITGIYSFSRATEAFAKAREKGSLKVLIDFSK